MAYNANTYFGSANNSFNYIQAVCDEITGVLGSAISHQKSSTHHYKITAHNGTMRLLPIWIGDDIYLFRLFDECVNAPTADHIYNYICNVEKLLSYIDTDSTYGFPKMVSGLPKSVCIDERLRNYFTKNASRVSIDDSKNYSRVALRRLLVQMWGELYARDLTCDRTSLIEDKFFNSLAGLLMTCEQYLLDAPLSSGKRTVGDLNGYEFISAGIQEFSIEFASIRTLRKYPGFFLLPRRKQVEQMQKDFVRMHSDRSKQICSILSSSEKISQQQLLNNNLSSSSSSLFQSQHTLQTQQLSQSSSVGSISGVSSSVSSSSSFSSSSVGASSSSSALSFSSSSLLTGMCSNIKHGFIFIFDKDNLSAGPTNTIEYFSLYNGL